jgi:hypothetical protein
VAQGAHLGAKRRVAIGLLAVAAALAAWLGGRSGTTLEIVNLDTRQMVLCACLAEGEEFTITFTHSVNQRPVEDTLRGGRDGLTIVKSRFDAFGAGMPEASDAGGTLRVLPDGLLEYTVNRTVPEVTVRVGRVAGHELNLKGRRIRLDRLAPPGSPLSFAVRRAGPYSVMKGRCLW